MVAALNQRVKDPVFMIVPAVYTRVPLLATDNPSVRVLAFKSIFPEVIVSVVATVALLINLIPAPVLLTVRLLKFSPPVAVIVCKAEPLKLIVLVPAVNVPVLLQFPAI